MPVLFHATTRANLASIREHGLLVSKAQSTSSLKGVWLHSKVNTLWAIIHTMKKHKVALEEVVILEVSIAKRRLTRFQNQTCKRGIYYTTKDIAPEKLGAVTEASSYGASLA